MGLFSSITKAVSGVGSLLGGIGQAASPFLGYFGDQSAARSTAEATEIANQRNIDMQYDFAKNGIAWKVADAKKAGLHPLFAMGAPTIQPSTAIQAVDKGSSLSRIGQNVSRAVAATSTQSDRVDTALRQENQRLQNDLLKIQIGNEVAKQPGVPARPAGMSRISGQGDAAVEVPSPKPSVSYSKNRDGSLDVTPSQDFTDRNQNLVSGIIPEIKWFIRNQVLPAFDDAYRTVSGRGYPAELVNGKAYYRRGSTLYPVKKGR